MACLIVILSLGRMCVRCLMRLWFLFPSSVVTECLGDVSLDSDWAAVLFFHQEGRLRLDSRMMPPAPQQNSHSSVEKRQWQIEEDQVWNARDRTAIARSSTWNLETGDSMKELRTWSLCLAQRSRKWISGESWRKRGTNRVA